MYYLYEEQEGGCDYTIGCGRRLRKITGVDSFQEAVIQACRSTLSKHGDVEEMITVTGEFAVSKAVVFAVTGEMEIDLDAIRRECELLAKQVSASKTEQAERAEFERLKSKFE